MVFRSDGEAEDVVKVEKGDLGVYDGGGEFGWDKHD